MVSADRVISSAFEHALTYDGKDKWMNWWEYLFQAPAGEAKNIGGIALQIADRYAHRVRMAATNQLRFEGEE